MAYDRTPVRIEEVLDIDRWSPQIRSWVSPTVRMTARTSEPQDSSASPRGSFANMSPMG
jgi:hypothetical protein